LRGGINGVLVKVNKHIVIIGEFNAVIASFNTDDIRAWCVESG